MGRQQNRYELFAPSFNSSRRQRFGARYPAVDDFEQFGVIGGISPTQLEKWFHSAVVDAYDWVMQTNVLGMGLFADGGVLASKPYAASANYINKMSDYCRGCKFDRTVRSGENACPFNFFYWDFLARHRDKLQSIGRMSFILANLDKMPPEELATIRQKAADWHW